MKSRLPLALLVLAACVSTSPGRADDPATAPAAPAPAKKPLKEPETELGGKMEKMGAAFRKLKRQVGNPTKNTESIQLVATMREMADASVKLVPAKAATIPETDRTRWVASYHARIADLQKGIAHLDAALKAGDNAAATKIVDELGALQREGHKEYKP